MENKYIREWIEHYKMINVDNIIIYDNNDIDGEKITDVIDDYIKSGYVIVEDCRCKENYQCIAYINCFNKYRSIYDWICYFDCDEFLETDDIKKFLNNNIFNEFVCIRIPWKMYTDSNIVEVNDDFSIKRFKEYHKHRGCKSIVNTKYNIGNNMTPHGPLNVKACDPDGNLCQTKDLFMCDSIIDKNYQIWLNHYMLKTIDEYIHYKQKRLYPDQSKESAKAKLTIKRFFIFNELTEDKIDYLKKQSIKVNINEFSNLYLSDKGFK
jgi:hypothetical protein